MTYYKYENFYLNKMLILMYMDKYQIPSIYYDYKIYTI